MGKQRKKRPKSYGFKYTKKVGYGDVVVKARVTPRGRKKVKVSVGYEA